MATSLIVSLAILTVLFYASARDRPRSVKWWEAVGGAVTGLVIAGVMFGSDALAPDLIPHDLLGPFSVAIVVAVLTTMAILIRWRWGEAIKEWFRS